MPNSIEFAKRYTGILDEVYQRASVSGCLTSPQRMVRQGARIAGFIMDGLLREVVVPQQDVVRRVWRNGL